jgi:enoyl-CoA hydratase/carnithine racemase
MSSDEVREAELSLHRDVSIARLVINRPQARNSLTIELVDRLATAVAELAQDGTTRVLILQGSGTEAFSAGFDIGAISQTSDIDPDGSVLADRRLDRAFQALETAPFPVIAAIRGHCIGGGFELALACDLRIATSDARFRMPPAQLGWVYGLPNLARFVSVLGASRARQVFLTGETVYATTALAWGIAHEVVDSRDLDARINELAERIAAAAPIALGGLKQAIAALARVNVSEDDLQRHIEWRRRAFASEDLMEGRAAFQKRRGPKFKGR